MSGYYTQTDCSTCLIGNAMRQCPLCIFYQGQPMKLSDCPEPDVAKQVDDDLAAIMAMLSGAIPVVQASRGFKCTIVADCPYCHQRHEHGEDAQGVRQAECLQGEYLLEYA